MEQSHRLGLDNRVIIRSDVPNEDLPAIYQSAKLFIYPSIFEGFGIPIIEAMSSKIPVITTRGGCFSEAGGPATCYIDPTNPEEIAAAMEQILTDSELTARMSKDGFDYISRFHGQETSKHLIQLYQNLTHDRP
jgi:glycosyltransferase involved in cell wall biosynthesis